ncbi:MAG TPA: cysteine--tRNA ligase [Candidatus Obscuribacterales bacterium]
MSPIQVFNTLSGKKEEFATLEAGRVKIYACGPTVYDLSHLGHARMAIVWDVVQRYLRFSGYDVTYVRNITDVDDKIINRSRELGVKPEQVARHYTFEFWKDMYALNVAPPDVEPRATEFIQPMIHFVEELVGRGIAYVSAGDVYFDVASFKGYGKLSKKNLEDLNVGAREQVRSQEELKDLKRNPSDFALWKGAREGEAGWESPWGLGRPGWHLECSVMIKSVLGETIDIHAGGEDLVFPHHENEIAQSESLNGRPLANYWLHNSFVNVNQEKMAKSLGNFKTIGDLLAEYSADTLRLFLLQTHYRNPIDFTKEGIDAARQVTQRLVRAASYADSFGEEKSQFFPAEKYAFTAQRAKELGDRREIAQFAREFGQAMDNDFNTAVALSQLFALADKIYQSKDEEERKDLARALKFYAGVLGLTLTDKRQELDSRTSSKIMNLVLELRQAARSKKDYATSDLIRNELAKAGINVMDTTGGGATWERS